MISAESRVGNKKYNSLGQSSSAFYTHHPVRHQLSCLSLCNFRHAVPISRVAWWRVVTVVDFVQSRKVWMQRHFPLNLLTGGVRNPSLLSSHLLLQLFPGPILSTTGAGHLWLCLTSSAAIPSRSRGTRDGPLRTGFTPSGISHYRSRSACDEGKCRRCIHGGWCEAPDGGRLQCWGEKASKHAA